MKSKGKPKRTGGPARARAKASPLGPRKGSGGPRARRDLRQTPGYLKVVYAVMLFILAFGSLAGMVGGRRRIPTQRGRSSATQTAAEHSTVLTFHHEQAGAGICDDLAVSARGMVELRTCLGGSDAVLGRRQLDSDQSRQLNGWIAQFKPFELVQPPGISAPGNVRRIDFEGWGTASASPETMAAIQEFAAALETELSPSP